ncbi:MAG: 50S ribosomal protein L10 [Bacillota bacterium]|jgi:large subunit ribosomal protein L10
MSSQAVLESKQQIVEEISDKLQRAVSAVLTDYRGLNVTEATQLRKELREAGVEYRVLKNTLTRLAVDKVGFSDLKKDLVGPTAIAFSYDDPVAPAKILTKFAKAHKKLELKAGVVEGKIIDVAAITALADLPSREVLLAQVLAGFQGPISGFVNVLQGNLRNFACVINAIKEQREQA